MIKIVIGSLVLCHLLVPNPESTSEQKTIRVLGEVLEMQKGSKYIEVQDSREALKVETDVLIVKGQNRPGIYQIDSLACLAVRNETDAERAERLNPKPKKEEKDEEEENSENMDSDEEVSMDLDKKKQEAFPEENKPIIDESKEKDVSVEKPELISEESKVQEKIEIPEVPKAEKTKEEKVIVEPVKEEAIKVEQKEEPKKKGLFDYLK